MNPFKKLFRGKEQDLSEEPEETRSPEPEPGYGPIYGDSAEKPEKGKREKKRRGGKREEPVPPAAPAVAPAAVSPAEEKRHKIRFADFFAFAALTVSAILFLVGPIVGKFVGDDGQKVLQIVNAVAQYSMLAAAAIPAWYFVRGRKYGWSFFYMIVLLVYVLGTVLGLI